MSKNSVVALAAGVREVLTPDHGTLIVSFKTSDGRGWGSAKMANGYQRYLNRKANVTAALIAAVKPFPSNSNVVPLGLLTDALSNPKTLAKLLAAANARGRRAA